MSARPAFQVRITYATGVVHVENPTDDLAGADDYARTAVLDYCLQAEVVAVAAKGYASGTVISSWDAWRVATDAQRILGETGCAPAAR